MPTQPFQGNFRLLTTYWLVSKAEPPGSEICFYNLCLEVKQHPFHCIPHINPVTIIQPGSKEWKYSLPLVGELQISGSAYEMRNVAMASFRKYNLPHQPKIQNPVSYNLSKCHYHFPICSNQKFRNQP